MPSPTRPYTSLSLLAAHPPSPPARSASLHDDIHESEDDEENEVSTSTGSGTPTAQEILDRDGPTRYGPRKRRKISRSKAGCLACRKRKKACDMARPVCGSCVKMNRDCEWPSMSTQASSSVPPLSTRQDAAKSHTSVAAPGTAINHTDHAEASSLDPNHIIPPASAHSSDLGTQGGPFDLPPLTDSFTPQIPNSMLSASVHDAWLMDLMSVGSGGGGSSADVHGMNGNGSGHGNGDRSTQLTDDLWDPAMWCNLFEPASDPLNIAMSSAGHHSSASADLSLLDPVAPLQPSAASIADTLLWSQVEASFPSPFPSLPGHPPTEPHPYIYLASRSPTISQIAPCLREALLAVAAHILTAQDNPRFEMISRSKESAANTMLLARLGEWQMGTAVMWSDEERWGLMAAVLVLMQLKRLRGDVWGYERYNEALRGMHGWAENAPDARALYEQVAMHDLLSTNTYRQNTFVNYQSPNFARRGYIFPLTGITLPLFPLIHRVFDLIAQRRAIPDITWDDDQHLDVVEAADAMLDALKEEKKCMDRLITARPHLATNRFLHESFRTAFLLHIRSYVLSHAPCTIDIGLLVRQNLSLLETMVEQRLPGLGLVHWVIFITAVHCIPSKGKKHNDERVRAMKLYEAVKSENIGQLERSKRIVQEVWTRNQGGQVPVDWMAILDEWDWELFFL